jgi:hypothetical protein
MPRQTKPGTYDENVVNGWEACELLNLAFAEFVDQEMQEIVLG